jgi:sugar phosphate isomerase/epimerase
MMVPGAPALHLTYCTNIHPGETWDEVLANVSRHVTAVKARVSPERPFGVGLRLSAAAAAALSAPEALAAFRAFLAEEGLYVFTINGFPYGAFHGTAVKERVYRPDWLEDERVSYSDRLAEILAALLPDGLEGSVSTVPGCFRPRAEDPGALAAIAHRLRQHARFLWQLRERTGRTIGLALEPEPHCVFETTAEGIAFFEEHLFSARSIAAFAALTGLAPAAAEEALRRHLGLCLDACHAAVEFEDAATALHAPAAAGVRLWKIQVSAGLRLARPDLDGLVALGAFAEGVYLHQVVIRRGATLVRYVDLPLALAEAHTAAPDDNVEWRVHFHVPLFRERLGPFSNTQPFLERLLPLVAREIPTHHLEVETYTWDVLPEEYRREPVVDAIARELRWTLDHLTT